jgi:hypothetical protein
MIDILKLITDSRAVSRNAGGLPDFSGCPAGPPHLAGRVPYPGLPGRRNGACPAAHTINPSQRGNGQISLLEAAQGTTPFNRGAWSMT